MIYAIIGVAAIFGVSLMFALASKVTNDMGLENKTEKKEDY